MFPRGKNQAPEAARVPGLGLQPTHPRQEGSADSGVPGADGPQSASGPTPAPPTPSILGLSHTGSLPTQAPPTPPDLERFWEQEILALHSSRLGQTHPELPGL